MEVQFANRVAEIRKSITISLAMLASLGIAHAVEAQTRRPASMSRSPLALDVAGVRLGMPIAEARTALRGGWRCRPATASLSFAQQVADEVSKRRTGSTGRWGGGEAVESDDCTGPGGEKLRVGYAETAAGTVVDGFSLSLSHDRFVADDVRRGLLAKFGPPTIVRQDGGLWCDAGYRCDLAQVFVEGPKVELLDNVYAVVVEGGRGNRARKADAAAVMAAADRQAPKRSGAAF